MYTIIFIILMFLLIIPDNIIVVCSHESFIPTLSDEVLASLPENQITEWNPGVYYGGVPVKFMKPNETEYSDEYISIVDYGL